MLKDIQKVRKLYNKINSTVNNKIISTIIERMIIIAILPIYFIKRFLIVFKKDVKADFKEYTPVKNDKNNKLIKIKSSKKYDVSILVAVYNVEMYIEECIKSLISQKTKYNYEIIFVNDGSTDNSLKILKKYEKYKNVKIINQENKGLADVRNVLIENANGKYVFFIDSDDVLEDDAIEIMAKEAFENDYDLVECSYYKFNDKVRNNIVYEDNLLENNKYDKMSIPGFACAKMMKVDLFENKKFPVGYLYEDTIMPFLILANCNSMKVLSNCFYGYRINNQGIVKKSKKNIKCCDTVFVFEQVLEQMKKNNYEIDYDIVKFMINCQFSYVTYGRIKNMDIEVQKAVFEKICDYFKNINITMNKKESFITKTLEKSIRTKNFYLWKETSKLINYYV